MTGARVSYCRTVDNLEMTLLVEMLPQLADTWQAAGHGPMDPRGNTCGALDNKYTGGPCTGEGPLFSAPCTGKAPLVPAPCNG